jgi:hypothetical protein
MLERASVALELRLQCATRYGNTHIDSALLTVLCADNALYEQRSTDSWSQFVCSTYCITTSCVVMHCQPAHTMMHDAV